MWRWRWPARLPLTRSSRVPRIRSKWRLALPVVTLLQRFGGPEDQVVAASLHDVLKDGGEKCAEPIRAAFGDKVFALVSSTATRTARATRKEWSGGAANSAACMQGVASRRGFGSESGEVIGVERRR